MKKKILFIIPSLRAGGAERVMSYVAKSLAKDKFEVTLLVVGFEKNKSYDVVGINVVYLKKSRVLFSFLAIFNYLSRKKPDIVISAISHLNSMLAIQSLWFSKIKFIGREVNVISVLKNIQPSSRRYYPDGLTKFCYKFLDIIICQSNDMASDMIENYNIPQNKIKVINNPITKNFRPKDYVPNDKISQFITVGSLVKRKGHERILRALAKFNHPFHYTIIGDGSEKEKVITLINELNLNDYVTHIPFTNEVSKFLRNSNVFLQGSHVEGFPNALLESCAIGTPVLAFDALGGINEIIEIGVNGFIASDEMDFIQKLNQIVHKVWEPNLVSESVIRKYNSEKIINDYENLFSDLLNNNL